MLAKGFAAAAGGAAAAASDTPAKGLPGAACSLAAGSAAAGASTPAPPLRARTTLRLAKVAASALPQVPRSIAYTTK